MTGLRKDQACTVSAVVCGALEAGGLLAVCGLGAA